MSDEDRGRCPECEEDVEEMMDDMIDATIKAAMTMIVSIAQTFDKHPASLMMMLADSITTQAIFQYVPGGDRAQENDVARTHLANALYRLERLRETVKENENAIKKWQAEKGDAGGGAWTLDPRHPTKGSA